MEVNRKFAEHVTGISLSLVLTKPMVVMLNDVANGCSHQSFKINGLTGIEVPTGRRLLERGLVFAPDPDFPGRYELTEAGQHVHALLQIAGIASQVKQVEVAE